MVEATLQAMRMGGIYDQGLLALAYAEAYQATGKEGYAQTAREILEYVLRDDKILTDWNGLMIAAFARAAQALDEPSYASAARKMKGL